MEGVAHPVDPQGVGRAGDARRGAGDDDHLVALGDPAYLEERLVQARLRGYEVMPSMQTAGVYNLSAPVLGADGQAIAALTCPYITPLGRNKAPDIAEAIAMIVETASALSHLIGGHPE